MKIIFPPEIINVTVESHFSQLSEKSHLLYVVVLVAFAGAMASLFFIKTEISVQCRGVIRSSSESVALISPLVAEVTKTVLKENMTVDKGDTLIWLNCEKTNERIQHLKNLISDNEYYLSDVSSMLAYSYSEIETAIY